MNHSGSIDVLSIRGETMKIQAVAGDHPLGNAKNRSCCLNFSFKITTYIAKIDQMR
jgi:hypothetical protein